MDFVSVLDLRTGRPPHFPSLPAHRLCQELTENDLASDDFSGFGQDRLNLARERLASSHGLIILEQDKPGDWVFVTTAPRNEEVWPPWLTTSTPPLEWYMHLMDSCLEKSAVEAWPGI